MRPSPGVIRIIQDKFMQKQHFAKHGVALGQFMDAPDAASLAAVGEELGYPYMLKARKGAYDGKGNAVVQSADKATSCFEMLGGGVAGSMSSSGRISARRH